MLSESLHARPLDARAVLPQPGQPQWAMLRGPHGTRALMHCKAAALRSCTASVEACWEGCTMSPARDQYCCGPPRSSFTGPKQLPDLMWSAIPSPAP